MDVLDAYQALAKTHGLPAMRTDGYEVKSEAIAAPAEAWNKLVELNPRQGWLLFQSAQMPFLERLPARDPKWGVLLAAEAITETDGASVSIALEQDGRGGWVLTCYTHTGEDGFLQDELEQLAHVPGIDNQGKDGPGKLKYRRYWRYDGQQGYVQAAACFIGFN